MCRRDIDLPDSTVEHALQTWQEQHMVRAHAAPCWHRHCSHAPALITPPPTHPTPLCLSRLQSSKLSGFHFQVSGALSMLGIEHKIEHLTHHDLFSIDIAIVQDGEAWAWGLGACGLAGWLGSMGRPLLLQRHARQAAREHSHTPAGRRIAIEADGPFHFTANGMGRSGEPTELGTTVIRRRLLRAGGWKVIPIPFYEWCAPRSRAAGLLCATPGFTVVGGCGTAC